MTPIHKFTNFYTFILPDKLYWAPNICKLSVRKCVCIITVIIIIIIIIIKMDVFSTTHATNVENLNCVF